MPEFEAGQHLVNRIWSDDGESKAPAALLRALSYAGNFVAGAFSGGELVGISIGFLGGGASDVHLHSHITGIDPGLQGKSVGFALKQFQRSWALENGMDTIVWTTDPLVRRNVYFNVSKLGATLVGYHDDFYGLIDDALNGRDETDRAVVRWELTSERAVRASTGSPEVASEGEAPVLLASDPEGRPVTLDAEGDALRVFLPEDIVRMRQERPAAARAWRLAFRETAGRLLRDGYRAAAITRPGWCILTR
jgi:predicted GNAT superfamily acetyltransferase